MKAGKDARRSARQLLKSSFSGEKIDPERARAFVSRIGEEKPRGYLAILSVYLRLLRLEMEKRQAVVESAQLLEDQVRHGLTEDLKKKYGDDLAVEFRASESLIGGMRVRVGNDVWDGSVRGRLDRLAEKLA
jgi:F-type H+-transporting ATPase subunit delta